MSVQKTRNLGEKLCKLLSTLFIVKILSINRRLQKCNSISNRIFSPCNLLFQISHHQVLLRFQPVKSKRRLETCVMVLVSFYEFLLVWPFHSKKRAKVTDASFEPSNLLFQSTTKIDSVKPVNQKKKVPDV